MRTCPPLQLLNRENPPSSIRDRLINRIFREGRLNEMDAKARKLLRVTVGVMGSAGGRLGETAISLATEMGRVIAERNCVLVTGACPGLPHYAVKGAKTAGGIVVGISPALNF